MNTMALRIQMPDDVDSQYDCLSSSSSFSSGGPLTPSLSYSDFSRRPSTASSSSWAQSLSAHSSSFSSQHSTAPSTPPDGKSYYPMGPFVPHASYNFSAPGENPSVFSEEQNVDLCDESFMIGPGPMNFPNEHLANWEFAQFSEGTLDASFMEAQRESSMDIQDQVEFAPATGLDAFFSRPMFEGTQTSPDFASIPHERRDVESSRSASPQTIVPSQTIARPSTPVSGLADGFRSPIRTPVRTPIYTSTKSEASMSPNEPFPEYSPYTTPSIESSPADSFLRTPRVWERRFTPSVLDYGCKTPSPSRVTKRGSRHAGQSLMDRSPFIVSKGDKIHKCHYPGCDGAFKRQEHLKRHQKKHAPDENPFKCVVKDCKKVEDGFNRTDNLKAHFKTHLNPEDGGSASGKGGRNDRITREEAREYGRKWGIKIFQIPLSPGEQKK